MWSLTTHAQITFSGSDHIVPSGSPVSVTISVENFNNVTSAQFSLSWNPSVLQFTSASPNPSFPPAFAPFGDSNAGNGQLGFAWGGNEDTTVANNTTFFTVNFNAIGAAGTSSQVNFTDTPTVREIIINGTVDVTSGVVFNPGEVNISAVPEPGEYALVTSGLLLGLAAVVRYRRRTANAASAEQF